MTLGLSWLAERAGRLVGHRTDISSGCDLLGLDEKQLIYTSRMVAKVDSAAVQDGYQLYHHVLLFTRTGQWCVIQQGMSDESGMARRYHWLSEQVKTFVVEPHAAICCDRQESTLNLVAAESQSAQTAMVQLARAQEQKPRHSWIDYRRLRYRAIMLFKRENLDPRYLNKILLRTYEEAPRDFEQLLGIPGVGPKTLRALALVAELIYGTPANTRDPARFAFAHGGKDRIPYPIDQNTYEQTITVLQQAVQRARVQRSDKVRALKRLAVFKSFSDENKGEGVDAREK